MFDPSREADKFMYAVSSIAMWTQIVYALVVVCCFICALEPLFYNRAVLRRSVDYDNYWNLWNCAIS